MYLAPLNYDHFFKKVFADLVISKQFLEDLLETPIESIEPLTTTHRVTDDSKLVEFDFRCKIKGSYVIVDMQQWYKPDVAHRFYLYHTLGTALQLEELPIKALLTQPETGDIQEFKDYRAIEPVLTVVWMVDDILGNTEDLLSYRMYPEDVAYFLKNSELWDQSEIKTLLEERTRLLKKLDNKTKGLDFIQANRLIFAFQKNIVKNQRIKRYIRWFELAAKSKRPDNTEADFKTFERDEAFSPIYQRIKKRLIRDNLKSEELQYITDETSKQEKIQRSIDGYVGELSGEMEMMQDEIEEGKRKLKEINLTLEEKDQVIEEKDQVIEEKDQVIEEKDQALKEKDSALEKALQVLIEKGLSEEEAKQIIGKTN